MPYFDKLDLDPTLFTAAAKPKANEPGDMRRGLTAAFQQIPQLGYGLMAGAGAALETAAGEGGIGTGIKQAGIRGFAEWGDKIAADSKETDSFSTAYNRAKEGDIGALADWLQYGLGYAGGQAVQLLAGAGAGTLAGKALLGTAAEKAAKGMVQKEAARLAAANAAQGGARVGVEDLLKQATKNVAGKIGQTTAVAAQSFGMTGGEIFGGLTADNADRALTGDELAKAFGATLAAGGLEFAADKLGLDLILGKSKLLKPAESITGMKGRAARAGVGALAQMPIEGGTEYLQTGIENYGRGSEASPFTFNQSEESQREAFDAAAMGAVGGGAIGAVGGGFSRATAKRQADADRALDDFKAATDPDAMVDAALRATDVPLDVPPAGGTTDADGVITPRRRSFYDEFSALEPAQQQEARALLNVSSDRTKPPQQRAAAKMRLDAMLLEAGIIPVGEVTEADPLLPVGEAQELTATEATSQIVQPPDFEQRRAMGKRVPTGEATELTPEEIELETIPQPDVIEAGGDLPLPEGMAPRTPKQPEATPAKPMTDADIVRAVVDGFRKTNTPQARAFVQDFDAGRITPADVLQLVGKPPQSPDERLAAAAAQAPKPDPNALLLTSDGQPYGTRSGAYVRAKKEGGSVIEVPGGWAVRPRESAREQPDMAGTAPGSAGPSDGGNPPAARGGGNLRPDADGAAGVARTGTPPAPRSGGGAAVAVAAGGGAGASLTRRRLQSLADSFRKQGTPNGKTFAAVLDGYVKDLDAGTTQPEQLAPQVRAYTELLRGSRANGDAANTSAERVENAPAVERETSASTAEAAIRKAVEAVPDRIIGSWRPVVVTANGRTQQFMSNIKQVVGDGKKPQAISLQQIRPGRLLSGEPLRPLVYSYKLNRANELVEEGIPREPSEAEAKRWSNAFESANPTPTNPAPGAGLNPKEPPDGNQALRTQDPEQAGTQPDGAQDAAPRTLKERREAGQKRQQAIDAFKRASEVKAPGRDHQRAAEMAADRLLPVIEAKDADALMGGGLNLVSADMNPGSRAAFEALTGVKLPKGVAASERAIDEWAGVTPEERTRRSDAKAAALNAKTAKRDAEYARGQAQRYEVKVGDAVFKGGDWVDSTLADGYTNIVRRGPKTYLANAEGQGFAIPHKDIAEYARKKAAADAATPAPAVNPPQAPPGEAPTPRAGAATAAAPAAVPGAASTGVEADGLKPAAATHKDPGEPAEPVTAEVVKEAIKTGVQATGRKPSEMLADLMKQIDVAMASAPTAWEAEKAKRPTKDSFVTFDVPGDGKFKVVNTKESLEEFRKDAAASPGFKDKGAPPPKQSRTNNDGEYFGVDGGSGSASAAARVMLDEGEPLNALETLEAAGKPMMFGNGSKDSAIPYTDATPTTVEGVDGFVGRGWARKKGASSWWSFIHGASGFQIGEGGTRAEAIALATKALSDEAKRAKLDAMMAAGTSADGGKFKSQDELRAIFIEDATKTQQGTFDAQDATQARLTEWNKKAAARYALWQSIMGKDAGPIPGASDQKRWEQDSLKTFLNTAEKQGRAAEAIKLVEDTAGEGAWDGWVSKAVKEWEKAAQTTELNIGWGVPLDLKKPPHTMEWSEVEASVRAWTHIPAALDRARSALRPWQEAHFEAIKQAVERGWRVPDANLYKYPGLIRSDLSDNDSDLAADAMVDTYRATKDYGKAVQAYREWGKAAPTADPFAADYAALVGKTIEQTVTTDDGKTAKLRMDAARALRDFDQRQKTLQDLKACLGRNG